MRTAYPIGVALAVLVAACPAQGATLVVTTTADAGPGSLRQAMTDAQAAGPDTILFDPALAGMTIVPATPLPQVSGPATTIDGDLGGDCDPDINISGASLVPQAGHIAIVPAATGAIVRGLALHSFPGTPIVAASSVALIECNFVGTDTGGVAVLGNGAGSPQSSGISVTGPDNTVGRNVVVNSRGPGIRVSDALAVGFPDFVGLVSDAAPRVYPQVQFSENCGPFTSNGDGFVPVDGTGLPFTDHFAMRLRGSVTVATTGSYQFNFSGVDDRARLRVPNSGTDAPVGGGAATTAGAFLLAGPNALEIGLLDEGGPSRLPLTITGPSPATLSTDGQALCPTGLPGLCGEVFRLRTPSEGVRLTRNQTRDNGGVGIALSSCQYANDPGDTDLGPNGLLNSPVIGSVTSLGGGDFLVTGTAPATSSVELYLAAPDPTGFGEGATFLLAAPASGAGNFSTVLPLPPGGGALTATATDAFNNTSEFGDLFFFSSSATGAYAAARSTSTIEVIWIDPNAGETGFRIERSTDGIAYTTAGTAGANATSFIDTMLTPNTLYYYRVVAAGPGGDAPASNRATASTFPATAAQVCYQRFDRDSPFVNTSGIAYDGVAYAVAWSERNPGADNIDLVFRRFDPATLAPLGPIAPISTEDMNQLGPVSLAWNGAHHGLLWTESVRGAAGSASEPPLMFALLDADGAKVRGNVRIPSPATFEAPRLNWDGTHWGVFGTTVAGDASQPDAYADTFFVRFTEDGTVVSGPTLVQPTGGVSEIFVAAAWSPQRNQYGVVRLRGADGDWDVIFQRFDASGAPIDAVPAVVDSYSLPNGQAGTGFTSVLWDGAWNVAYSKNGVAPAELGVYFRRVDGVSGMPLGSPTRISDPAPDASNPLAVFARPGGGHAVFAQTVVGGQMEVTRMQVTAAGDRDGSRIFVTPNDGQASQRAAFGGNGTDFLVTFGQGLNGTITQELQAVRVAADGSGAPTVPATLTTGHGPAGADLPRGVWTAPLGAGFVAAWVDGPVDALRLNARTYGGNGQILSTLAPLTLTSTQASVGLASVGDSFALAWRTAANDVVFARYTATGAPITGERTIDVATGSTGPLVLGWDGEHYAVFYAVAAGNRLRRVDANGDTVGSAVAIVRGPDPSQSLQWTGDGWALLTRNGVALNGSLEYVRFASDGTRLDGPVAVETALFGGRGPRSQQVAFNGRDLAAVWMDWEGTDPPGDDIYFTVIARDGTKAFDDIAIVSTSLGDAGPRVYASGANFRVVTNAFGTQLGLREVEVTPAGAVQGMPRFLSNRSSGIGSAAVASNGVTTATFYFPSGLQHLYFHTSECLADASAPACPAVTPGFAGGAITLAWPAVADPETGIVRYNVYRDGLPLAELDPNVLSFADGGYLRGGPHTYQVRAMNGGLVESANCPIVGFDKDPIFANGFEG